MHNYRQQAGFTLIEVLVAALILAVGLLGVAGLQTQGLRNNVSAMYRTQAVQFTNDIADRIRSNPTGSYAIAFTTAPSSATNCASSTANCSVANMTGYDLTQWKCMLGNFTTDSDCTTLAASDNSTNLSLGLPSGDGSIALNSSVYTVTVRWAGDKSSTPVLTSFAMDFEI